MAVGFIVLGLVSGVLSGLMGLGGGFIIVPALHFLFGMSQKQAQGTTLALLVPPIGILAAMTYYKQGQVDVKVAALVCLGFFFGGRLGAKLAVGLSNAELQKVFGGAMILIGLRMLFGK